MTTEPTRQHIVDQGEGGRKYFTIVPNILDDCEELTPFEFRLLFHYYRVGVDKQCFEGVRTTAKKTKMSVGKVSECRRSLSDKGFVKLSYSKLPDRMAATIVVTVADIWKQNLEFFEGKRRTPKKKVKKTQSEQESLIRKRTRSIQNSYTTLLGYDPEWQKGEGKAARRIAEQYTLPQFKKAYAHYKGQKFWQDKILSLRYLAKNMREWEKQNGNTNKATAGNRISGDIGDFLDEISP